VVKLAVAICYRLIRLAPGSIPGRCKHLRFHFIFSLVVAVAFFFGWCEGSQSWDSGIVGQAPGRNVEVERGLWGFLFLVGRRGIGS
jgi:hypothetical protein